MRTDKRRAISAAGEQRLAEWLTTQKLLAPPAWRSVDTATLVRYCAGLLAEQEAQSVETALVADANNRELWLQVQEVLDYLQAVELQQISHISRGSDLRAEVARTWLAMVHSQAQSVMHQPNWWERLQGGVAEGRSAAMDTLTLLSAVYHRWMDVLRVPVIATARAGDRAWVLLGEGMPQDVQVLIDRFEVTRDGNLFLRIVIQNPDGSPCALLSGTPITVTLDLCGESVPLLRGTVSQSAYEVSLPVPAPYAQLPAGELPQAHLVIAIGEVPPLVGGDRVSVPVEVEGDTPQWAEIQGLPESVNGRLRMRISLPPEMRQRYAHHSLAVDIQVTPLVWQRVGAWQIGERETQYMDISALAPGLPEGTLPTMALIRLKVLQE